MLHASMDKGECINQRTHVGECRIKMMTSLIIDRSDFEILIFLMDTNYSYKLHRANRNRSMVSLLYILL